VRASKLCRASAIAALVALAGCASEEKKDEGGGAYLNDAGTTAGVKAMIFNETGLDAFHVSVTTEKGLVHLTGTVKSRAEMAKVLAAARKVDGVKGVKNELQVTP
jgi:osmotically-inducible protein OsmY